MLLALDTCLERCSVALYDGQMLRHESQDMARGHAENLMPMVARVMAGFSPQNLTRIGVTIGPGSFTGLRVGLSAAKSMALALNIPCIGLSTLQALSGGEENVLVVIDARHGNVYSEQVGVLPPLLRSISSICVPNGVKIIGSGAKHFGVQDAQTQIDIATVARLTFSKDPATNLANPFYLKEADVTPQIKGILVRA
jgi:tRNA threonylcarbamoyladenosine biosynthesis protein TsaB